MCLFVVLSIQHAMFMRRIRFSPVVFLALQYFHTFPHKGHDFRKRKDYWITKCVFWFSLQILSEKFLILRRTEQDMIKHVYWSACKLAHILARFHWSMNFVDRFSKNSLISNFIKIHLVGDEFFHTDGQTDSHEEAYSRFSQFANTSKTLRRRLCE